MEKPVSDGLIVSRIIRYFILAVGEDLRAKLQDLDSLENSTREKTAQRGADLERALGIADKFQSDQQEAVRALRDIQDNLLSQDSPGVDAATIEEQQKELKVCFSLSTYYFVTQSTLAKVL